MTEGGICRLIEGQLNQTYDAMRMQHAWERVLDGTTPPEVITRALVSTLSQGRYQRRDLSTGSVIHIHICATDTETLNPLLACVVQAPSLTV